MPGCVKKDAMQQHLARFNYLEFYHNDINKVVSIARQIRLYHWSMEIFINNQ